MSILLPRHVSCLMPQFSILKSNTDCEYYLGSRDSVLWRALANQGTLLKSLSLYINYKYFLFGRAVERVDAA